LLILAHIFGKRQVRFVEEFVCVVAKGRHAELQVVMCAGKMAGNGAQLAYVIAYVPDVNQAAEFYKKAFGLQIRPQNKTNS